MLKKIAAVIIFIGVAASLAFGAKTVFNDGSPSLGIKGTQVTAAFLNSINNANHQGLDQDGSDPQIVNADVSASAAIAKSKISTSGTWAKADLPSQAVYTDVTYNNPAWINTLAGSKITSAVANATNATSATNATNASYATTAASLSGLGAVSGTGGQSYALSAGTGYCWAQAGAVSNNSRVIFILGTVISGSGYVVVTSRNIGLVLNICVYNPTSGTEAGNLYYTVLN